MSLVVAHCLKQEAALRSKPVSETQASLKVFTSMYFSLSLITDILRTHDPAILFI